MTSCCYIGNTGEGSAPHATENHVARALEANGVTVVPLHEQRFDWAPSAVPEGTDLLLWTHTHGFAPPRTHARQSQFLDAMRTRGIPTVSYHLDRWFDLAREPQLAEPFFRCLPGWTEIEAASAVSVSRRRYSGELVRVLAGEHELAATPNHPVLTPRGWLPIGELVEGDHLVCYGDSAERASGSGPQVQDRPATIQQIFEAADSAPDGVAVRRERVGGVPMDFHGDGSDADVDVVWAIDDLVFHGKTRLGQPVENVRLLLSEAAQVHWAEPGAELVSVRAPGDLARFAMTARADTRVGENAQNSTLLAPPPSERVGDREHGLPVAVAPEDVRADGVPPRLRHDGSSPGSRAHGNSRRQQTLADAAGGPAEGVGDLLERRSALVHLAQVSRIDRVPFDGHVFNLSTNEGAYLAGGIVTHNCDLVCTADGGNDDRFAALGINHTWFPPGVSGPECELGTFRPELASDVAFVGSWQGGYHPESTHRRELLEWLQATYGDRCRFWPEHGQPAVRGEALRDLYASVKVLVGDSCLVGTGKNARYISDRVPETVGRGGLLVHPHVDGVTDGTLYEADEHLLTWEAGDWDGLRDTIDAALADDDLRHHISLHGRLHVLANHTYEVRMRDLLADLAERGLIKQEAVA